MGFAYYSSRLPPPKPGSFLPSYTYTNPQFPLVSRLGLPEWGRSSDRLNLSTSCCLPVSRHQQLQIGKQKPWWGGLIQLPSTICEAACTAFKATCQGKDANVQPLLMAWLSWQHLNWKKSLLPSQLCPSWKCILHHLPDGPLHAKLVLPSPAETSCPTFTPHHRTLLFSYTKYTTKQSWEVHLSSLFVSIASSPSHREHSSWHHLPQP